MLENPQILCYHIIHNWIIFIEIIHPLKNGNLRVKRRSGYEMETKTIITIDCGYVCYNDF